LATWPNERRSSFTLDIDYGAANDTMGERTHLKSCDVVVYSLRRTSSPSATGVIRGLNYYAAINNAINKVPAFRSCFDFFEPLSALSGGERFIATATWRLGLREMQASGSARAGFNIANQTI
jgi:hypothetical protein